MSVPRVADPVLLATVARGLVLAMLLPGPILDVAADPPCVVPVLLATGPGGLILAADPYLDETGTALRQQK